MLNVAMLKVVMLNVAMLKVVMLNVTAMQNVFMLSVEVPSVAPSWKTIRSLLRIIEAGDKNDLNIAI